MEEKEIAVICMLKRDKLNYKEYDFCTIWNRIYGFTLREDKENLLHLGVLRPTKEVAKQHYSLCDYRRKSDWECKTRKNTL
uniref:hypothetical protein n=1 Tax=Agathobacter sp. TaxID=2021311 RepID=UPI00405676A4